MTVSNRGLWTTPGEDPQAKGWWLASDGRWYPPDAQPATPATEVPNMPPPEVSLSALPAPRGKPVGTVRSSRGHLLGGVALLFLGLAIFTPVLELLSFGVLANGNSESGAWRPITIAIVGGALLVAAFVCGLTAWIRSRREVSVPAILATAISGGLIVFLGLGALQAMSSYFQARAASDRADATSTTYVPLTRWPPTTYRPLPSGVVSVQKTECRFVDAETVSLKVMAANASATNQYATARITMLIGTGAQSGAIVRDMPISLYANDTREFWWKTNVPLPTGVDPATRTVSCHVEVR